MSAAKSCPSHNRTAGFASVQGQGLQGLYSGSCKGSNKDCYDRGCHDRSIRGLRVKALGVQGLRVFRRGVGIRVPVVAGTTSGVTITVLQRVNGVGADKFKGSKAFCLGFRVSGFGLFRTGGWVAARIFQLWGHHATKCLASECLNDPTPKPETQNCGLE